LPEPAVPGAASTRGFPPTPYLPSLAAAHFLADTGLPPSTELPRTTYIEAFFGKYLSHHDSHLLDGPSPRYADISFES
jgi:hypothetical protein